ncbi:MAG: hypothetical protein HZA22_07735 [Nitrospirae bacterium]|nr:hypothetical protein [Nitrospirota bacterium]
MGKRAISCILFLVLSLSCAYASDIKRTGTFSDLEYNEEGGDLLGSEIRIVVGKDGYEGTFQISEGEPDSLVLLSPVVIDDGNNVSFKIKSGYYAGKFTGRIAKDILTGTLTLVDGTKIKFHLKRGRSYWE